MRRFVSLMLCGVLLFSCCAFQTSAVNDEDIIPYVVDFSLTPPTCDSTETNGVRASGLITSYKLGLSVTGTTLYIRAETYCIPEVVRSGFKNFVVERRKSSSSSWSEYYYYGDLYNDTYGAVLSTTLVVQSGYQYRITCKHYAKKSLLVTQSVSNTSNVVLV